MKQKMRQTVNRFVKSCSFRKNSPQVAVQKMSGWNQGNKIRRTDKGGGGMGGEGDCREMEGWG